MICCRNINLLKLVWLVYLKSQNSEFQNRYLGLRYLKDHEDDGDERWWESQHSASISLLISSGYEIRFLTFASRCTCQRPPRIVPLLPLWHRFWEPTATVFWFLVLLCTPLVLIWLTLCQPSVASGNEELDFLFVSQIRTKTLLFSLAGKNRWLAQWGWKKNMEAEDNSSPYKIESIHTLVPYLFPSHHDSLYTERLHSNEMLCGMLLWSGTGTLQEACGII